MNYGFYLSAGGAINNMHRQDILANNLANVQTTSFKPDDVDMRQRLPARMESATVFADPKFMLERLGGGRLLEPTRTNFEQGPLESTENPLDLGIEGEGFLVVDTEADGAMNERLRMTRDGRLTINADGQLVSVASGLAVLDANNEPIMLDRAQEVEITSDGRVAQNGDVVAQLQFLQPDDTRMLSKAGENLYRLEGQFGDDTRAAPGRIRQGHVESSAVDPILALNSMVNASKSVASNSKLMQYHDHITGQAVGTFGRVA